MNDKACSCILAGESGIKHRFIPAALVLLSALALFLAGCGQSPEEQKAAKAVEIAQTTGSLLVKSNRSEATLEVTHLAPAGEPAPTRTGVINQPLTALPPGQYAVVVRDAGWPALSGAVEVAVGQTTEVTMNFKSGSLRLDSVPAGAKVKHGGVLLGETPVLIPELPAGECELSLEYAAWPPFAFKATIAEHTEATATARLPHGRLTVDSIPSGAYVRLGGTNMGRTPLTLEQVPAGSKRLLLQSDGFPQVVVSFTLEDGGDVKIRPELGAVFPVLDPTELLRAVWVPDDPNALAPSFDSVGRYEPRNGVVKNINRRKVHSDWIEKKFRFSGVVESYDRKTGEIDFLEDKSALSRFRVVAIVAPEVRSGLEPMAATLKGRTLAVYGTLAAVEEPRWPARSILLELSGAQLLNGEAP